MSDGCTGQDRAAADPAAARLAGRAQDRAAADGPAGHEDVAAGGAAAPGQGGTPARIGDR